MGKHLYKEGKRRCLFCKNVFILNTVNFYASNKKNTCGFAYHCKSCYPKLMEKKNPRKILIKRANFSCEKCGLKNEDCSFFDIDHINPMLRKFPERRKRVRYSLKESENLQVLCPNCHRLKTIQERPLLYGKK